MFNVGLTYKIFDWLNVAARYRMDDSYIDFERKYMPLLMMYSLKVPKKAFMNTTIIKTARNMRISW